MSTADIVPIAIVLDERVGYTLWAPPWEEDGEEWQAFLGAEDKLLVFASPGQLAQHLRSDTEHDLIDHPAWDDVSELSPRELLPDEDYVFDFDGVYDLAAGGADRWAVADLADALDMVARIAECCDDEEVIEPLADVPEIGMLELGHEAFYGRSGEKAWDRVGEVIAEKWETVCERLENTLNWVEPVDLDKDLADAQAELDAIAEAEAAAEEAGLADDGELDETDLVSADEDEDEDLDDEEDDELDEDIAEEDDELEDEYDDEAVDEASDEDELDEADEEADQPAEVAASTVAAAEFWESEGILPVRINLADGDGVTLRCYVDDKARFLGAGGKIFLFRSPERLLDFIGSDKEHDLVGLATWSELIAGVAKHGHPIVVSKEDDYDLAGADVLIHGKDVIWDPAPLAYAADLLLDVAEYAELERVTELLNTESKLSEAVAAARAGQGRTLRPNPVEQEQLANEWGEAISAVTHLVSWRD